MPTPRRYVCLAAARDRFGDRVDRLGSLFEAEDPLADAAVGALAGLPSADRERMIGEVLVGHTPPRAPRAVVAFGQGMRRLPFWVDHARAARGGRVLLRTGLFGGLVLAFRSLVLGYCAPAGNKPLVFSGRLREAASRRVSETGRFVQAVYLPDGLRVGAPGFVATGRVRLIHAQVRHLLRSSSRWHARDWGMPINQVDMAGTVLLFSLVLVDGLRKFGFRLSQEEVEDVLHLWRVAGFLMGVRDELLPTSELEARMLWELLEATQEAPDLDSTALAQALVEGPLTDATTPEETARAERFVQLGYGLSRFLIGDRFADALGYPKNAWRFAAPALRTLVSGAGTLVRRLPGVDRVSLEAGLAYWRHAVAVGLGGEEATFALPEAMRG